MSESTQLREFHGLNANQSHIDALSTSNFDCKFVRVFSFLQTHGFAFNTCAAIIDGEMKRQKVKGWHCTNLFCSFKANVCI